MSKDKFTPEERKILAQNPLSWTAKLFLVFVMLYSYFIFRWVINDPEFDGLGIATFMSLFLFLFTAFISLIFRINVILGVDAQTIWKSYRKLAIIFIFVLLMPAVHKQFFVLFVSTENHTKNLSTATVEMKYWEGRKPNRITSGGSGYYLYVLDEKTQDFWHGRCSLSNLDFKHTCEYAKKENEGKKFTVKYITNLNYPLHYQTMIYEIKALDGSYHRDVNYHLQLYARNKRYILYYLLLVHILPMFFIYIAYVLTFKHLSNHTED